MTLSLILGLAVPAIEGIRAGLTGGIWLVVGAVAAVIFIAAGSMASATGPESGSSSPTSARFWNAGSERGAPCFLPGAIVGVQHSSPKEPPARDRNHNPTPASSDS